ncbi:MAG: LysM peptidoglycan-binding domain-containing protein [Oligoflexia bacterium]|nr:LysM peptidoglycan-binding domain-containing protein [Oligoflexia bacterium]
MLFRCLIFFFALSSCQHFVKTKGPEGSSRLSRKALFNPAKEPKSPYVVGISLDSNKRVEKWMDYFTGSGRKYMNTYLERSSRYLPIMKAVLKKNNLPEDLVYVALIESGFSPKALSRANAVGYWQFIHGTGRRYGLKIDGFVDERRDPILSTQAAAQYFKDLYSLFGSWQLALAAYNSGEYRVNRAVLRHYTRDFWLLSSKKALPRETRNYVPKLIAAIRIAHNPEKYGFYNLEFQPAIHYDLVPLKKPISLLKLAQNLGVSEEEIKKLNPMYKGEYVPIYEANTHLRVPAGLLSQALASLDKSFMSEPKYKYHYHYWYRVRRGDSLYKIARRHKTTVRKLRRANNMRSNSSFLRVGQRIKIPSRKLVASSRLSSKRKPASLTGGFHKVKKGQSLSLVAKLYGLQLSELKRLNNMQGTPLIHPGQKLRVKNSRQPENSKKYHLVRKGETLIEIAKKHNIPLPRLMKENSLNLKSILLTGTRLIIPK